MLKSGAALTGTSVGSSGSGVSGSSLGPGGVSSESWVAWLMTDSTPAGSGELITVSYSMMTLSLAARLPMVTCTVPSPALLPMVTVPALVTTLPTTSSVVASGDRKVGKECRTRSGEARGENIG